MIDRKDGKRRRSNGFLEIANGLLTLVVLVLIAAGALFFYGASQFYATGPVEAETTFLVERGSSLALVAERLENQGVISNRYIFQFGGLALRKQREIKAGEFVIKANWSMADVLKEITEGKPITYAVTIPEGFTAWQVIDRLKADTDLTGDITGLPPEGSILPFTYDYDRGTLRADVLAKMQDAMREQLAEIWASCDPTVCGPEMPLETPQDLVTLASIVERETGVPGERGQVAAVFINRLKKGMRLQSDPTIIYGITKGEGPLGRGLTRAEIEAETPYNTYQIDGLPAGPIANPGVESLKAVANPPETDDLYFVAAGPVPADGHLFAPTYKAHRANVAKYREIERQQAIEAEAEADAAKDAIEAEQATAAGEAVDAVDATPQ